MKVTEIHAKGIVTKSNLPDADFVINPYIGCQHACLYCYADFMKRFTGHSGETWGTFVDPKTNCATLANCTRNLQGKRVLIGSVTDAYQPLELKYQLSRKILIALKTKGPSVEILTKSPLVVRDIDVLGEYHNATVGFSLAVLNKDYSRKLEPCAASPSARLGALKKCHDAGLTTYLFISPIFPYLTEIREIIELAAPHVDYFMFENLNVRPSNRARVMKFIRQTKPDLLDIYEGIFSKTKHHYWSNLEQEILDICKKLGKEARIYFHHGGFKSK